MVRLSPAQQLLYRHLLVNQDRTTLDAIMTEAQKHDGAAGRGGGGKGGSRSSFPIPAVSGAAEGGGTGEGDAAKTKKMNDTDYRKLMNLLLQLRSVLVTGMLF